MTVTTNTVGDLFKKQHPEAAKNLEESNCWDMKVIGPASFEDEAVIVVMIQWKSGKTWSKYNIELSK